MALVPRYREIADDLHARLAAGEFQPGAQFPPIAELQRTYDVPGLNTVRQALSLLIEQGLLESVHGRGTFVRALPSSDGGQAGLRADLLELQNTLNCVQAALARVLRHLDTD